MLINYTKVAIRNLRRYKFFSGINIIGLAISMAICMAIIMLVADQLMYDRFNTNSGRIYRVVSRQVTSAGLEQSGLDNATTPLPLRDELLKNYSGVEKAVRFKRGFGNHWMEVEGHDINVPVKGFFADPEALTFFEFELEHGDPVTALKDPFTVVLTRPAARKLFREENPMGLTLKVGEDLYKVTGILKDTPNKSHIVFDGLASMATVTSLESAGRYGKELDDWLNFWEGWTYVMLEHNTKAADIGIHLDRIYNAHISVVNDPERYKAKFALQPLLSITPGNMINNSIGPSMPWMIVYFLSGLAGIIMLTSCFNFTNLSIARALTRAKEVGVRKVNGAGRFQIFSQFLSESIVVSLFALLIAFLIVRLLKPMLMQLNFARIFQWDLQANYAVYGVFLSFALAVGLLAGILPAILLSGFQPVKVLKKLSDVRLFSRIALRRGLIISQFVLSLIFIISVTLLYNQLQLFLGKDHGFDMTNNAVIRLNGTSPDKLKAALSQYTNLTKITASSHLPATGESRASGFTRISDSREWTSVYYFNTDEGYQENLSLALKAGRFFDKTGAEANKNAIVLNESAVKSLHFKNALDAVGEEITYQQDSSRKTIIGVVGDYNHQILLNNIEPLALMYTPMYNFIQIKYTGSFEDALPAIEKSWASVNPGMKLDCKLLKDKVSLFYDTIFGDLVHVVGFVALLAVFISCMGLMGMATYTTETRTKEIAIRKVLGSSDRQLILLLSNGFIRLLVIAVAIGVPLAWFLNDQWLKMIAYRTAINGEVIGFSVGILMVLGGLTIGSQTLRAAFMNPVDNLRNE